jgi:hypothetical protein
MATILLRVLVHTLTYVPTWAAILVNGVVFFGKRSKLTHRIDEPEAEGTHAHGATQSTLPWRCGCSGRRRHSLEHNVVALLVRAWV